MDDQEAIAEIVKRYTEAKTRNASALEYQIARGREQDKGSVCIEINDTTYCVTKAELADNVGDDLASEIRSWAS